jgi:hypothetical protein
MDVPDLPQQFVYKAFVNWCHADSDYRSQGQWLIASNSLANAMDVITNTVESLPDKYHKFDIQSIERIGVLHNAQEMFDCFVKIGRVSAAEGRCMESSSLAPW